MTVTERESDSGELAKLEKLKMVLLLPHLLKNVSRLTLAFKSMQKVTQLLARNDFGLEDNWKLKSCSHVVYWHRKLGSFGYVMLLRYKLHFTRKNIKKNDTFSCFVWNIICTAKLNEAQLGCTYIYFSKKTHALKGSAIYFLVQPLNSCIFILTPFLWHSLLQIKHEFTRICL